MLPFQAKTSGKFSREELEKLRRELQHHKEKVHEYHALLESLGRAEGGPGMFQTGGVGGWPRPQPSRCLSRSLSVWGWCTDRPVLP